MRSGGLAVVLLAALAWPEPARAQAAEPAPEAAPPPPPAAPCPDCPACPECPAAAPPGLEADQALLGRLRRLTDPADAKGRAAAAGELGESRDARAIAPLIHAVGTDRDGAVRGAAIKALGKYPTDASREALARVLGAGGGAAPERVAATEALGAHGSRAGADALWKHRGEATSEVGKAIRRVLAEKHPELWAEWSAAEPSLDQRGRLALVPWMALHGGFFMTALADVAGGDPSFLSFVGGSTLGGLTAYLLTRKTEITHAQSLWLGSTATWGLLSGVNVAGAADIEDSDAFTLVVVGGQVAGLGAGLLTARGLPYSTGDVSYIDAAGVAGAAAAGGGLLLAADADLSDDTHFALVQAGITAGLLTGGLVTRGLTLTAGDSLTIAAATTAGAWAGGWTPPLVAGEDPEGEDIGGGILLGAATGFALGTVMSQHLDPEPRQVGAAMLGGIWGTSIGGGTALLLRHDASTRLAAGLVQAGGAVGLAAGAYGSRGPAFSPGQRALTLFGMTWGAWQGAGFSAISADHESQVVGGTLFGFGAGGTAAAVAGRWVKPDRLDVVLFASGGIWGGWLAGWAAHVADKQGGDLSGDDILMATLLASDVGLLLTGLALSSPVGVSQTRLGWINAAGLGGMGLGTSVAAVLTDDVAEGNLVGSAIGLVAGVIVTAGVDFDDAEEGSAGGTAAGPEGGFAAWWPSLDLRPDGRGGMRAVLMITAMD
jgi:hypothetical protein